MIHEDVLTLLVALVYIKLICLLSNACKIHKFTFCRKKKKELLYVRNYIPLIFLCLYVLLKYGTRGGLDTKKKLFKTT